MAFKDCPGIRTGDLYGRPGVGQACLTAKYPGR